VNSKFSYYDDSPEVKTFVKIGRELISLAEENKIYPQDDALWNAAVTAGNKLVTAGTPWARFKDASSFNKLEKEAVLGYLQQKG
tara:strand:- start:77 stop:328 length:252 start_codon:yes stop_codon:yes gene_type:complete